MTDQHKEHPLPRARRNAQTIGVIGVAETSKKNMLALLDDYLEDKRAHFVIPVTNDLFTPTVEDLVEYLLDKDIPFTAITDGNASRGIKTYLTDATDTSTATDVGAAIVNALRAGEDGILFALWDETQDDVLDVAATLELAEEHKIPVLDLCEGLVAVNFVEPGDEPQTAAEPEPEDEPVEAPRARRRAAEEPEDAAPVAAARDDDDSIPDDEKSIPPKALGVTLGVRKLKRIAKNVGLVTARAVGPMDKDAVLELLYPLKDAAPVEAEAQAESVTDAPPWEDEPVEETSAPESPKLAFNDVNIAPGFASNVGVNDHYARREALSFAVQIGGDGSVVLKNAERFLEFMQPA